LIEYTAVTGKVVFKVQVVPRASRTEVVGAHNGALRVRLAAPPVDGAANDELVQLLAKTFKVARNAVKIVSGKSARLKQVSIEGNSSDITESLRAMQ
jgi:uncharacterized protein (TIGR00251 family)